MAGINLAEAGGQPVKVNSDANGKAKKKEEVKSHIAAPRRLGTSQCGLTSSLRGKEEREERVTRDRRV